ncbi:MAG: hypothetical protein ACI4XB_03795 [Ruminococcus sp.]
MKLKKEAAEQPKPKKPKREKKERTPKEATALMLGIIALVLAILAVGALMYVSTLVAAILGGCAVLGGFASLMVGKGGILPAIVGIGGGFLTVLSAIITMRLQ